MKKKEVRMGHRVLDKWQLVLRGIQFSIRTKTNLLASGNHRDRQMDTRWSDVQLQYTSLQLIRVATVKSAFKAVHWLKKLGPKKFCRKIINPKTFDPKIFIKSWFRKKNCRKNRTREFLNSKKLGPKNFWWKKIESKNFGSEEID